MRKALAQGQPAEFESPRDGASLLGMAWGGFSGAVIGVGISLSIGLFYSGATLLIATVIGVSLLLGVLFGSMLACLLADDAPLAARASNASAPQPVPPEQVIDLSDYRGLRAENERKALLHQLIIANNRHAGTVQMALPHCLPDIQLFERIVEQAHTS